LNQFFQGNHLHLYHQYDLMVQLGLAVQLHQFLLFCLSDQWSQYLLSVLVVQSLLAVQLPLYVLFVL